jgi:hypothetical protein
LLSELASKTEMRTHQSCLEALAEYAEAPGNTGNTGNTGCNLLRIYCIAHNQALWSLPTALDYIVITIP